MTPEERAKRLLLSTELGCVTQELVAAGQAVAKALDAADKRERELEDDVERLQTTILDLVTLAGLTCALVDRCRLYGCADALRGAAAELRQAAKVAKEVSDA